MLNKSKLNKMIQIAQGLNWTIKEYEDYYFIQKYSPADQDFFIEIDKEWVNNIHDFIAELNDRYESFDISEETYLWLDETGHGKNGAPYDMRD